MIEDEHVADFYAYMRNRELIRQRRLAGLPRIQWTQDPIFQAYRFTNIKRDFDRTTVLLRNEFYDPFINRPGASFSVALLNAAIFRYTGTIEAARAIGWSDNWDKERFLLRIGARMAVGETTFTPAYLIPNAGLAMLKHELVADIVDNIWKIADDILDTNSWEIACNRMCSVFGVGSFMSKEILLDYKLCTRWIPTDWQTFTPAGPGGCRGASRVKYGKLVRISEDDALRVIREVYTQRAEYWPTENVALDLTDIQWNMCEYDKYKRAATGQGKPRRRFHPTIDNVTQAIQR